MAPKRGRGAGSPSPKKRAKVVQSQLDLVAATLKDPLCDVPGDASNRKMLQAAVVHALCAGKDERHKFQDSIAGFIGDAVAGFVAKWQKRVDEAQVVVSAAESEKAKVAAVLEGASGEREKQESLIKTSKGQLQSDSQAVEDAQAAVKAAEEAVSNHSTELAKKQSDFDEHTAVYKEHFEVLKTGSEMGAKEQKVSVSCTTKLVKKLHADASLMSALPSTLMKKAEARGEFDTMVLSQVETILTSHLQTLQQVLDSAEEVKRTKDATLEGTKSALEAAKAKKATSAEALKSAKEALKPLEDAEKAAKKAVKDHDGTLKGVTHAFADEQKALEGAQKSLAAFNSLRERVAVPPPAPPQDTA